MEILKPTRKSSVKIIVRFIKEGKIIICPTDTVYGLLADATNKKAVERIFKIKRRKKDKAVPIFVKNIKMAKRFAVIDKNQEKILKKYWPGKLTAILKRKSKVKIFGVAKETIALRVPNYELISFLLRKTNKPLTGTSANISDLPSSTKIQEIIDQFRQRQHQPDLVVDSGDLPKSKPSTIIDLVSSKVKILRQGAVKIKLKTNAKTPKK